MIRKPEGWSIVLAGFWNRSIFLPDWVGSRLFNGGLFETESALIPTLPLVYRDEQVAMEVSGTRLIFRPLKLNNACMLRAETMARTLLSKLPETPVFAVGVNFGFRETAPPAHVLALFTDVDDAELTQQNWLISERKLSRRLTRRDDVLSLTTALSEQSVDFDFNFNTDAGTTPASNDIASGAVREGRVVDLHAAALGLLRETYRVELEEEGNDDGPGSAPSAV